MSYASLTRLAVVACTVGLVASTTPAQAIDPKLLPPDTEVVLSINLRALFDSELAKSHQETVRQLRTMLESHLADADAQRYMEKLDFDLLRDLDSITVSTSGSKMPEFILLQGKFHPEKIAAAAKEAIDEHPDHIKALKVEGQQAYEIRVDTNENPVYAGLVGKDKFIVTQTKDGFADAVGRIKSSEKAAPTKLKKELRDVLDAAGRKQGISLVATGPALVKLTDDAPVPNIEQLQGVLQGISALNLSLTLDKEVNFELVINSKDKMAADDMAKLAGVGLAGAKMLLKGRAEKDAKLVPALKIVETMRVKSQNNNFVLTGHITAEMLGKIIKDLPQK